MKRNNTYIAINASAGSGKTYTLVQRVLILCLAYPNKHDAIKHILALTFTNKAANEMKKRILEWLKEFTQPHYKENFNLLNIQNELNKLGIKVSLEDLHQRSQKVLDYILHHYSTLNIGTIDKFNARLVRSFSYELGLAHQFNLEIQSEPYLIEAVDKLLEEIGKDHEISDSFMDFVSYNLDNEERININTTLYQKAKKFVQDIHYENLKDNINFDWNAYHLTKDKLRQEIYQHKIIAKKIAEQAIEMMNARNLENADFAGGGNKSIRYFFEYFLKNNEPKLQESIEKEEKKIISYRKGASKVGKPKESLIEEILEFLIEARQKIIYQYVEAEKKNTILNELLPLKFNKEIQNKLKEIEEENDLVLLSKFNILINENLKNEPSAFIYEKIGTRYQHFFLDEFQDTSKMQWENLIPLRDNAITSENHTFTIVGDPKQSIYRFRGGDSDLMLDIINQKEMTPIDVSLENLKDNWRSAKNIVTFNNELYDFISKNLEKEEHRILFSEKAKQIPRKENLGRVRVCLSDNLRSNQLFQENVVEQMHRNIQECINNGFLFSDITILCRSGKEIQGYSQLLGQQKVRYKNEETFIKTISEKGLILGNSYTIQAVIWLLKWNIQPENHQHLIKMMYSLSKLGRINISDFSVEMLHILSIESKIEKEAFIFENYQINLQQKDNLHLNLYNFIEFYVKEFSVSNKEVDFLLNFLELLYNFTQNAGLNIKDFIKFWDEEGKKTSIQASENIDAIKIMTIHAAKGLEFPIVFLPMANSHKDTQFSEWIEVDGFQALKSVNINNFNKAFSVYDESIDNFNFKNIYKNKIDRFCVQYVATTRPSEQLFLYLQRPSKSANYLEIYDFVSTKNINQSDEFDLYPEVNNSFRKIEKQEKPSFIKTINIQKLSEHNANIGNITIATPSKNYQKTRESVRVGIFAHEILAKITSEKDIDKVLQYYVLNGEITQEEKENIHTRILNVIHTPNLAKFFQEDLNIINEKELMISENGQVTIYRPDRLISTEEGYYIIDFKTGKEKSEHQNQLYSYRLALEKLGKKVVETQLIYL